MTKTLFPTRSVVSVVYAPIQYSAKMGNVQEIWREGTPKKKLFLTITSTSWPLIVVDRPKGKARVSCF